MIRVLVVRDSGYFGIPVRVLLKAHPDIDVLGAVPLGDTVADEVARLAPDVVVIDTEMMVGQILPLTTELHARVPSCAALVLCDPTKRGMLPPRRRGGHVSFLLKDASEAYLAESVRRLAKGERIVHPRLQYMSLVTERHLTTRELMVLALAAEGGTIDDIAHRLYLSGGTVRNYLSSVISKTGARDRGDAIRIVRRDGWLR